MQISNSLQRPNLNIHPIWRSTTKIGHVDLHWVLYILFDHFYFVAAWSLFLWCCQTWVELSECPKFMGWPFALGVWRCLTSCMNIDFMKQDHLRWQSKHLKGQLDIPVGDFTFFDQMRSVGSPCWWCHVFGPQLGPPEGCVCLLVCL